jgi:hypothetical protein
LKHQQRDLTPVLRRPVELARNNQTSSEPVGMSQRHQRTHSNKTLVGLKGP